MAAPSSNSNGSSTIVEVEQKFKPPPGFAESLVAAGGVLLSTKRFRDIYIDTVDTFVLAHEDYWLRKVCRMPVCMGDKCIGRRGATLQLSCNPMGKGR